MLTPEFARRFSQEWINAWNNHDLEEILSHYAEEIEFSSPLVVQVLGIQDGTLRGKKALKEYFQKGLELIPGLKFTFENTALGANSLTVLYRNSTGVLSAETMVIGEDGKVIKAMAQYTIPGEK